MDHVVVVDDDVVVVDVVVVVVVVVFVDAILLTLFLSHVTQHQRA